MAFELEFLCCVCVWVMTTARVGFEVKVIDQGQRSVQRVYGRGNAVGLTSILDRGQFFQSHSRWLRCVQK